MDFDGATLMLSDEFPEYGIEAPPTVGGSPVTIHLHVDDADAVVERAAKAGASIEMAPTDQFYGERSGILRDPFGHRWNIGHSIEEYHRKRCKSATTIWWPREAGNGAWPSAKGSAAGLSHRPGRLDAKWLAAVARHPKAPMAVARRETRRRGDEDGYVQPRSWAPCRNGAQGLMALECLRLSVPRHASTFPSATLPPGPCRKASSRCGCAAPGRGRIRLR